MRIALLAAAVACLCAAHSRAAIIAVPEGAAPYGLSEALPPGERGLYADLADALAHRSATPIEIRFVPFGRMLEGIRTGAFDYAFGLVVPEKSKAGPFIADVGRVPMVTVARPGLTLKSLDDLHRFNQVGYLRGGTCGAAIDADADIHRVSQDNAEIAIRKMAAGRLDGWCSVKPSLDATLRKMQLGGKLGDELACGELKIGLQASHAKADTGEAKEMAAVLAQLAAEGVVGDIFARYFGAPYPP